MTDRIITWDELSAHKTKNDLWFAVHGKVYAVTPYLFEHPGGIDTLVEVAGQDATEAFEDIGHSDEAREVLAKYLVGTIEGYDESDHSSTMRLQRQLEAVAPPSIVAARPSSLRYSSIVVGLGLIAVGGWTALRSQTSLFGPAFGTVFASAAAILASRAAIAAARLYQAFSSAHTHKSYPICIKVQNVSLARPSIKRHAVLDPRHPVDLPISRIEQFSHDSKKFTLDLPSQSDIIGLPIGQHVSIRAVIDGKMVSRSYTPTSSDKDRGKLELVIKSYDKGLLTGQYLNRLQVGDKVNIAGPRGAMRYRRGIAKHIAMIAGGTGITPMFQLIRAICEDDRDNTRITLLYANQTEEDILLARELDSFASNYPSKLQVHHILSRPSMAWTGARGRIDFEVVKSLIESASPNNKAMICGPPGLVEASKDWLERLGYDKARTASKMDDQVFVF